MKILSPLSLYLLERASFLRRRQRRRQPVTPRGPMEDEDPALQSSSVTQGVSDER